MSHLVGMLIIITFYVLGVWVTRILYARWKEMTTGVAQFTESKFAQFQMAVIVIAGAIILGAVGLWIVVTTVKWMWSNPIL